jgi:hypothetical protein
MFNLHASIDVCNRICKDCYAIKEQVRFPSVLQARVDRHAASLAEDFSVRVIKELGALRVAPKYFRIHASGDFYSQDYVNKWIKVIKAFPSITFYAYTKRAAHFDFTTLKRLSNMGLIDSLQYGRLNYGPLEKAPQGAFVCPDHLPETRCGDTCTYCMTKGKADVTGIFFKKH